MTAIRVIALFTLRESLRRRVFTVVAILTVVFLALYGLGIWRLYADLNRNELGGTGVRIEIVAPGVEVPASRYDVVVSSTSMTAWAGVVTARSGGRE